MNAGLTPGKEQLDALNDALIHEAADRFLFARLVCDEERSVLRGNELIFLSIQRQEFPSQWVEIGKKALLKVCDGQQSFEEFAKRTPFFTANAETLQLLARISCSRVRPSGIYTREEALRKFSTGELTFSR